MESISRVLHLTSKQIQMNPVLTENIKSPLSLLRGCISICRKEDIKNKSTVYPVKAFCGYQHYFLCSYIFCLDTSNQLKANGVQKLCASLTVTHFTQIPFDFYFKNFKNTDWIYTHSTTILFGYLLVAAIYIQLLFGQSQMNLQGSAGHSL